MIFLVDAQLPPALARWLIQQGHTAQHVDDIGLREAEDIEIWNQALNTGAVIITKDEDFAERTARTTSGPVILWLRVGNATNRALMRWLNPRWPQITTPLDAGTGLSRYADHFEIQSRETDDGRGRPPTDDRRPTPEVNTQAK